MRGVVDAIHRSHGVVEFSLDGTVLTANENFLSLMGYELAEVQGQPHRLFCEPELARSREYADLWRRLSGGAFESGVFKRLAKDGRVVWQRASYNPVLDDDGRPVKVVKLVTDITEAMQEVTEQRGAVSRSEEHTSELQSRQYLVC